MTDVGRRVSSDIPAQEPLIDPWLLAGMPGPLRHASYLTERLAPQYRLIVDVLLEEQSHSLTGVARVELPELLAARARQGAAAEAAVALLAEDVFDLDARMEQLQAWGVVEMWQDRATEEADFLRNRNRYQLTPQAAALHRFVLTVEASGGRSSSTALLAPTVIAARLSDFTGGVAAGLVDDAEAAWAQIEVTLRDMADAAGSWQAQMAAALAGAPSSEKVETLRATLLAYVDVWGAGVDVHSPQIAEHVASIRTIEPGQWRALALARVGSEAAEEVLDAEVISHLATLETLERWFSGADSQGRKLRRQVRDAIGDLVRGHRTLLHVGGAVTRQAELLRVAAAIEAAPDDATGWDVWCRATGLFTCRHLAVPAPERADVGARTSMWDSPPAPVQARLRTHGPKALVGTPARIPDLSAARAAARARAADERRALLEAEAGIRARSGTSLSSWGPLTGAELDLLLEVLTAAREERHDGSRSGATTDGRWNVRVMPAPQAASASITTEDGTLVCGDAVIEVTSA
jgi:uncharacterized protein (TIGR02677 family)